MKIDLSIHNGTVWVYGDPENERCGLDVNDGNSKVYCDITKQEALDIANALLEWVNA